MDETDRHILAVLQDNGRISNRELAEQIALSSAPCWRRVRQMEETGVIQRYVALVDPAAVGLNIMAFTHVSLENHHTETVAAFDSGISQWPEVLECHATSGGHDYMLKVVVRDMAHYDEFLSNRLLQLPQVRTVNTSFSLRRKKYTTALSPAVLSG